jgi:hypothetical protein
MEFEQGMAIVRAAKEMANQESHSRTEETQRYRTDFKTVIKAKEEDQTERAKDIRLIGTHRRR